MTTISAIVLVTVSVIFGGIYYALFLSGWMAVREMVIEQNSFVSDEEIKKIVQQYLQEKSWLTPRANNIFTVDSEAIQSLLTREFPILKRAVVRKKYLHGLIIQAERRETAGVWCFQKRRECLFFDNEGVAFDRASDSSGTLFLMVDDISGEGKKLGEKVTDRERIEWLFQLKKEMDKEKIGLARMIIPEEWFRVDVKTTEGWEIYFSTIDPLVSQVKALSIFLANKVSFEQRHQLQYIDVRIPQRVYYKLINAPSPN